VVVPFVFETMIPDVRWWPRPRSEALVGLLSVVYVVALLAFVAVGPFVVSGLTPVSFGTALQRVVLVAGVAYAAGMALLLR
jgi:thiol:disulfide interchange protein